MRPTYFAILFIAGILMSGCQPLLKLVTGVRNPEPKEMSYILKKQNKYHLNEFEHLYTTNAGTHSYFDIESTRRNAHGGVTLNPLLFKNDALIWAKDTSGCGSAYAILTNVQDTNLYYLSDTIFLHNVVNSTTFNPFDSIAFNQATRNVDYVILIYWGTFDGIFNKTSTKKFAQFVKQQIEGHGLNAKAYYVNFDLKHP